MENASNAKTKAKKVLGIIGTVLFFLSFLPLIYAVFKGFTGVFFGFQGFAYFFGLFAIFLTLVSECLYFFLPVLCLIYQVGFGSNYIRHHKKLDRATKILIIVIIAAAVISSLFSGQLITLKHNLVQPKIKNHLAEVYGEAASDIRFEIESINSLKYSAHSPVLPQDKSFEIQVYNSNESIYDDLLSFFVETNEDYLPALKKYIAEKEHIPEGLEVIPDIISIDFKDFKYGDDITVLLGRTNYRIKGFNVDYSKVNDQIVTELTNKVWKEIYPNIPASEKSTFEIDIFENGTEAISVYIHPSKENKATVRFLVWESKWDGDSKLDNIETEITR